MGSAGIGAYGTHPVAVFAKWYGQTMTTLRKVAKKKVITGTDILGAEGHEVLIIRFEGQDDGLFFDMPQGLNMDSVRLLEVINLMFYLEGYPRSKSTSE